MVVTFFEDLDALHFGRKFMDRRSALSTMRLHAVFVAIYPAPIALKEAIVTAAKSNGCESPIFGARVKRLV
jgi:hypothetical protein